jgi:hypothetical protein
MPIIKPIQIRTRQKNSFKAVYIWITSRRKWMLMEDFFCIINDKKVIIEAGFVFDGASILRIFWAVLSPTGLLLLPSLIHDYIYTHGYLKYRNDNTLSKWVINDRRYADELFRDSATAVNGMKFINYIAWIALYLFAGFAWHNSEKSREEHKGE